MSAETLIGGAAATVSLVDSLVKLVSAANEKGSKISTAEIIKRLPGEAYGVAKQIGKELQDFRSQLVNLRVDLKVPLADLENHYDWWKFRKDRAANQAIPRIEGLKGAMLVLSDDFVAVASCQGAEETLAATYAKAAKEKDRIRRMADPTRPVGAILDDLIKFVDERAAELASM